MEILAVVPTWESRERVLLCLASLARSRHAARAVVVDQGSRDGTADAVSERFPDAVVLRLERNAGFAAGVNLGIERALALGADAVLLLNDDARLEADALERLARALERDPDVGLAAPLVRSFDGRVWWAGGTFSRTWAVARHDGRGAWPKEGGEGGLRVGFAPLAVALLPRRALERVGLLDERFFLYWEDADLALRLERAGLSLAFVPRARAWHEVGATAGRRQLWRFAHETRSFLCLVEKHLGPSALLGAFWHHGLRLALLAVARSEPAFVLGALRGASWFLSEKRRRRRRLGSPLALGRSAR